MTKIITALNSCNFHRCKSYFHSVYVIELKYFEHGYSPFAQSVSHFLNSKLPVE